MAGIATHMDPFAVSDAQVESFRGEGYLHLKGVWPQEDIEEIRKDMDEFADGFFTNKLDSHHYASLRNVHLSKKMCDIGDAILGARAVPIGSIAFYCKPDNPLENGSVWHQDNYAAKVPDCGHYLNLAIVVDDADQSNGALMVVPGSHKCGDLACTPKPNFSYDDQGRLYNSAPIGNDCELPEGLPVVQLEYQSGDVLVVHGGLVHKAEKNRHESRWRRTIYYVYIKDGEPFWPGWTSKRSLLERYDSPECV